MDSKLITLQKIDGIYDIQPLITPALSAFEFTILLILIISFVVGNTYLVWMFIFSNKAKSRREILNLQKRYIHNTISPHDTVYDLCQILRKGLDKKQLNTKSPPPKILKENKQRWDKFINELSDFRYKNSIGTSDDISPLFKESLFWFKR